MRDELQPACLGNSYPYDVLIDEKHGPTRLYALREARQICGVVISDNGKAQRSDDACPLIEQCLVARRKEPWAAAILASDPRNPPVTRDSCGTTKGHYAHSAQGEAPCAACKAAHTFRRVALRRASKGVTPQLLAAHAEHTRLRAAGVAKGDIPRDVAIGESAYQMARRKARMEAA